MHTKKSISSLIFAALILAGSMAAHAQTTGADKKTFVGINVGQMTVGPLVVLAISREATYMPVHIHGYRSLNRNFALSGLALFRVVRDQQFQVTETGFAVGPCFTSNHLNGFFADCKVGFAFAIGHDYDYDAFTRTDFVLQPEFGYFITLAGRFTMAVGLGMQSMLKIAENPKSAWIDVTNYERYLPVLNVSLGIKF